MSTASASVRAINGMDTSIQHGLAEVSLCSCAVSGIPGMSPAAELISLPLGKLKGNLCDSGALDGSCVLA